MEYLSHQEIESVIKRLEGFGYPQIALVSLLKSLHVDPDKFNFSTDGSRSNMPREIADAVLQYAAIASQIKAGWRDGVNPYDLLPLLPDRNSGHVTKKMALDALKIVTRGHVSKIAKTAEIRRDSGQIQQISTDVQGENFYVGASSEICPSCGSNFRMFRSNNPFDDNPPVYLCFACGNVEVRNSETKY